MSATSVVGSARKPFYSTLTFQLVVGLAAGGDFLLAERACGFSGEAA